MSRIVPRRARRPRSGFALLALLVVIVFAAALAAAVVLVSASASADQARLDRTRTFFDGLTKASTGIPQFQADINGKTPGRLSHLTFPITSTQRDLCGALYTATGTPADIDEWSGRYAARVLNPAGTPVGIGIVNDTLSYDIVGGATRARIQVKLVPLQEAIRLDARVDTLAGTSGSAAGTIQWGAGDASGLVTVTWVIPIAQSCPPPNSGPTAAFTWICNQLTCTFTSTSTDSDGTIVSYGWTFGDATSSTIQNPVKTYASAGIYTTTLLVSDDDGDTGNASQSITARVISLSGVGRRAQGNRFVDLTWSGAISSNVDVYRDGVLLMTTANDGAQTDATPNGTFTYRVCEQGTQTCSNNITVSP